jgi:hypothetical protein
MFDLKKSDYAPNTFATFLQLTPVDTGALDDFH